MEESLAYAVSNHRPNSGHPLESSESPKVTQLKSKVRRSIVHQAGTTLHTSFFFFVSLNY